MGRRTSCTILKNVSTTVRYTPDQSLYVTKGTTDVVYLRELPVRLHLFQLAFVGVWRGVRGYNLEMEDALGPLHEQTPVRQLAGVYVTYIYSNWHKGIPGIVNRF